MCSSDSVITLHNFWKLNDQITNKNILEIFKITIHVFIQFKLFFKIFI